ncbi:hypothetical protein, partial [Paenibacillus odorifer]|uniref:hypothetical protein n=2 Tax=Paenibacillus odorifer TaxID=189426 RepID=UPI001C3D5C7C
TQPNPTQPNPILFLPAFLPSMSIAIFTVSCQGLHPNPTKHYQPKVKHMLLTLNEREAMNSIFCEIKVSLLTIEGLFTIPKGALFHQLISKNSDSNSQL